MEPICELLDSARPLAPYQASLAAQQDKLAQPVSLPSARILEQMATRNESFFQFAMRRSNELHTAFRDRAPAANLLEALNDTARASLDDQKTIEAADRISFTDYLDNYFAQSASDAELSA